MLRPNLLKIGHQIVDKIVSNIGDKKTSCGGLIRAPILPHWADRTQKFLNVVAPWPVHSNLVRIDCGLQELFPKDWLFGPQSHCNSLQFNFKTTNQIQIKSHSNQTDKCSQAMIFAERCYVQVWPMPTCGVCLSVRLSHSYILSNVVLRCLQIFFTVG